MFRQSPYDNYDEQAMLNQQGELPRHPLRVGYLTENLNAGGSERQLSQLAIGMVARGHIVETYCYNATSEGTYDQYVQDHGVILRRAAGGGRLEKLQGIKRWVQGFQPHILHGFMKRASSLAVLANLPRQRFGVVASDFSTATYAPFRPSLWVSLVLFHLADCVATETVTNRNSLCRLAPTLRHKLVVIRNGVDDKQFSSAQKTLNEVFQFLCVATVSHVKNPVRLVQAVQILREQTNRPFVLHWVGRHGSLSNGEPTEAYRRARTLIDEHGLQNIISFKGLSQSVVGDYQNADALVHVSVQDGIPNAVVEGMACGLPLVVSQVSDLPLIVAEADNGITCNAFEPKDIARAMKAMLELPCRDRDAMGRRSQNLATTWFGVQRFVKEYESRYYKIRNIRNSGSKVQNCE